MKESSCSFNMVKSNLKEPWCFIGMLDTEMRINDNIDPIGQRRYVNFMKCYNNDHLFTFHTF